nr:protein S100-G-like [Labrus bergylta]
MSTPQAVGITKLKVVVTLLVETYKEYASAGGCKKTLDHNELKTLIQTEFPELLQDPRCQKEMKEVTALFDHDGDGVVTFEEFASTISALSCCMNQMSQ